MGDSIYPPSSSLYTAQAVLDHINSDNESQNQIALRAPSSEITNLVSELNAQNRKPIILGTLIKLVAGDPRAIWRAQNSENTDDFQALFLLLSRRPDPEMRFLCEIEFFSGEYLKYAEPLRTMRLL